MVTGLSETWQRSNATTAAASVALSRETAKKDEGQDLERGDLDVEKILEIEIEIEDLEEGRDPDLEAEMTEETGIKEGGTVQTLEIANIEEEETEIENLAKDAETLVTTAAVLPDETVTVKNATALSQNHRIEDHAQEVSVTKFSQNLLPQEMSGKEATPLVKSSLCRANTPIQSRTITKATGRRSE